MHPPSHPRSHIQSGHHLPRITIRTLRPDRLGNEAITREPSTIRHLGRSTTQRPSAFQEWCQMTSWHGILDFSISKNVCMKIMWAMVILMCTFISVNQCISLLMDFTSCDQWVTSVTFESPPEGAIEWPNMFVCNLNQVFQSRVEAAHLDDPYAVAHSLHPDADALSFYDDFQASEPRFVNGKTPEGMVDELRRIFAPFVGNKSLNEIMGRMTLPCNKTAIHCGSLAIFDLRKRPSNGCCVQGSSFMNCFMINTEAAVNKSYKVGRDSAAYFLFDPHISDYYKTMLLYKIPSAGLSVQLLYGNPLLTRNSELVMAPGSHVTVSMVRQRHRTVVRHLNTIPIDYFKKPCNDTYQYMHFDFKNYSERLCAIDCRIESVMSLCGCNMIQTGSIPIKGKLNECSGQEVPRCHILITQRLQLESAMTNESQTEESRRFMTCARHCQEACQYDTLDITISTAKFPAPRKVPAFTTYLNRAFAGTDTSFTEEETKQLIFFEMFYELKQIRVTERVTRLTIEELVSNIGGTLGVWTGLGILSVYQCLVYGGKGLRCGV